ncbi:MAG: hypothetical protein AAFQ80_15155 [Cyanobacteria bacterium J06621_8]
MINTALICAENMPGFNKQTDKLDQLIKLSDEVYNVCSVNSTLPAVLAHFSNDVLVDSDITIYQDADCSLEVETRTALVTINNSRVIHYSTIEGVNDNELKLLNADAINGDLNKTVFNYAFTGLSLMVNKVYYVQLEGKVINFTLDEYYFLESPARGKR